MRRQRLHESSLSDFQRKRLLLIGGFQWEPREDYWFRRLQEYVAFVDAHACEPRRRARGESERTLGLWMQRQAALAVDGKLTHSRHAALAIERRKEHSAAHRDEYDHHTPVDDPNHRRRT